MYLDSAIIVKLLVREPESEWFGRNLAGLGFQVSELALSEVSGALLAKERTSTISPAERIKSFDRFFSMIENEIISLLPLNRQVIDRARSVQLACHPQVPLRTLDALHVATCDLHQGGSLCATDARIRAACQRLGIGLMPEKLEDITSQ